MVNQISIQVANVVQLISLGFTRIEVWASADQGNSFQEITADTSGHAVLTSLAAQTTFQMGGKLLKFSVDGGPEQSVNFSSVLAYWTPTQVAAQINTVAGGLASVVGASVVLTSSLFGRASSVAITYCDAHDLFSEGDQAFGTEARISIDSSTKIYTFQDLAGGPNYLYKYRFSANGSNPVSNFSEQIIPSVPNGIGTVFGTATFIDVSGKPLKARMLIGMVGFPASIGAITVSNSQTILVDADENGFLQQSLVPGMTVRVAIEGTHVVREFVVPSFDFDFLQVMGTATDPFTIQTPDPLLTRRSV